MNQQSKLKLVRTNSSRSSSVTGFIRSPLSNTPQTPIKDQQRIRFGKDALFQSKYVPEVRRETLKQSRRRSNSIPSLLRKLSERGIVISTSTVSQLKDLYKLLDSNMDGIVTREEIAVAFKTLGMSCPDDILTKMIERYSTNKGNESGIDPTDFIEMCVHLGIVENDEINTSIDEDEKDSYVELFHIFDASSKDGRLTDQELRDRLEEITGKSFSMREVQSMLAEIDENSDGLLDLSEFIDLMEYLKMKKQRYLKQMKGEDNNQE